MEYFIEWYAVLEVSRFNAILQKFTWSHITLDRLYFTKALTHYMFILVNITSGQLTLA